MQSVERRIEFDSGFEMQLEYTLNSRNIIPRSRFEPSKLYHKNLSVHPYRAFFYITRAGFFFFFCHICPLPLSFRYITAGKRCVTCVCLLSLEQNALMERILDFQSRSMQSQSQSVITV